MKRRRKSVVPPAEFRESPRYPKYDLEAKRDQLSDQDAIDQLSSEDRKRLRTLLRKYGRDQIIQVAKKIDVSQGRGRPPRGDLPEYERIHFAQWIEEEAEERRQAGSKSPIKDALYGAFEMDVGELGKEERRNPGRFNRWLKTHKKKWQQGKRELEHLRECQRLYDEMRKAQQARKNEARSSKQEKAPERLQT
jgi:hypothetical protein